MKRWLDPTDRRTMMWCAVFLAALYFATGERGTAVAFMYIAFLAGDDLT